MENNVWQGTELKLNINIEPIDELSMDQYNWEIIVYCNPKIYQKIDKSDAIKVDTNNYVVCVDTTNLGTGNLKCKVIAYIPDGDFKDNLRTEVVVIATDIKIIKG